MLFTKISYDYLFVDNKKNDYLFIHLVTLELKYQLQFLFYQLQFSTCLCSIKKLASVVFEPPITVP